MLEENEEWSDLWIAILTTTPVESMRIGRREPGTTVRRSVAICEVGKCDEVRKGKGDGCLIEVNQTRRSN
jgi:hypothetical protein